MRSCRASRSARSAFVNFFFIVLSQKSFDVRQRDGDIAHIEEWAMTRLVRSRIGHVSDVAVT